MTIRSAVPDAEKKIRVWLWHGVGALLAVTLALGVLTVLLEWRSVPFIFSVGMVLLIGIPAVNESLRAARRRADNSVIDRLEDQLLDH